MEIKQQGYKNTEIISIGDTYSACLKTINNISFTGREIDITACLLNGRSSKKTASFLSISPKTVEIHIRNIMLKLGCNSRESIIDFVEKSNKFVLFRGHYSNLLIKATFELELKKLLVLVKNNTNCIIFYYKHQRTKDLFVYELEKHLNIAGIKTCSKAWEKDKSANFLTNKEGTEQTDSIIYVMSNEFAERLKTIKYEIEEEVSTLIPTLKKNPNPIIFLLSNNKIFPDLNKKLSDFIYIDLTEQENYYFLFFEILKKVLLTNNINKNLDNFKRQYETLVVHSSTQKWSVEHDLLVNSPSKAPSNSTSKMTILGLPPRNGKFTGREDALAQIKTQLDRQRIGVITQTISGLGGVGKTQLATEFAYQVAESDYYEVILWISAETLNSINNTYRDFSKFLQIDVRGLSTNKIQALVHHELAKKHKGSNILFILDNVSNYDSIQYYTLELHKHLLTNFTLHILITSRSQHWPEKPLILDTFAPQEALMFVKKHLPDEDENSIIKLAETLHYFPLALNQATAYIKKHTNVDDYLELYATKKKDYLDKFPEDINQYTESLWKTWDIALIKLSNAAKEMLFIASYLYPDDISITFFDNLAVEERGNIIENLRKYSFITLINNNKSFKLHRLLQEVVRMTIISDSKDNIKPPEDGSVKKNFYVLNKAINLLKNKFTFSYAKHDKWNLCCQYVMHAQSLAEQAINIGNGCFHTGIQLYAEVAMYLTHVQQDNNNARQAWEKILTLAERHYSKDKSFVLVLANIYTHLGFVMRQIGNIDLTIKYLEKAILIYKSKTPDISVNMEKLLTYLRWDQIVSSNDGIKYDHSFTLLIWGLFKHDLADFRAAKDAYEQALEILSKCKIVNSIMLSKVSLLQNLGKLYRYCGDIKKAKNVLNTAKIIVDDNFPNHLEQAYVYERIASLLYYMGMCEEAKENLEKCLKIRLSIHSKDHYRIGLAKSILGLILCASNCLDEGIANLKQAEIIYKNFEENHIRFVFLYINTSYAFEMHKEYDNALQYLIKAQRLAIKHWGEKSSIILSYHLTPTEKFSSLETSEKNINYYTQALELTKKLFGRHHIRVARYCYILGRIFENVQNKDKARRHYRESLSIASKQHFKNKILVLEHQKNIEIIQEHLRRVCDRGNN